MAVRWLLLVVTCLEFSGSTEGASRECISSLRSKYSCSGSNTCERLQCSMTAQKGCTDSELQGMGLDPKANSNMYNKFCNKPKGGARGPTSSGSSGSRYNSKGPSSSSYRPGGTGGSYNSGPGSSYKSSSSSYKPSSTGYKPSSSGYKPSSSGYKSSSSGTRPGSKFSSSSSSRGSSKGSSYKSNSKW